MKVIPSMLNICNRGIQVNPTCPICNGERESTKHAILQCEVAERVWSKWRGKCVFAPILQKIQ